MRTAVSFFQSITAAAGYIILISVARDVGRRHGQGALGFNEGLAPVAITEAVDAHTTTAAAAGVDELVVTQVDAGDGLPGRGHWC